MAELWKEAGLPDGVFNVVHGDKVAVDALLDHPGRRSRSPSSARPRSPATSTRPAPRRQAGAGARRREEPHGRAARRRSRPRRRPGDQRRLRLGGRALHGDLGGVAVGDDRRRRSSTKIAERRRASAATGDGRRGCDMGPLVTAAHRDRVAGYIDAGEAAGREARRRRARRCSPTPTATGFFSARRCSTTSRPTCRSTPTRSSDRCCRSSASTTYDEALELINANPYGNGTAIFTNDGGAARRFQNEVEVGMIGINVPIPVPVAYYSFGGWKSSLFGDTHAHGAEGVHFFTRGKVVTTRWLDPEPRRHQPGLPPERLMRRFADRHPGTGGSSAPIPDIWRRRRPAEGFSRCGRHRSAIRPVQVEPGGGSPPFPPLSVVWAIGEFVVRVVVDGFLIGPSVRHMPFLRRSPVDRQRTIRAASPLAIEANGVRDRPAGCPGPQTSRTRSAFAATRTTFAATRTIRA